MTYLLRRACGLILALSLATPLAAQQAEPVSRPSFLAAMGLLQSQAVTIPPGAEMPGVTLSLPESEQITPGIQTLPAQSTALAAYEFRTKQGLLAESLVLTAARVDPGDAETRRFAMANLLVLRSFPALQVTFPDAQLLGFMPVIRPDGLASAQLIGTFTAETGAQILFRHVAVADADSETAIVALINVDPSLMPVRDNAELGDTYAGLAIESLTFDAGE